MIACACYGMPTVHNTNNWGEPERTPPSQFNGRFSHIGYPAQWIAFLLHVISPTINLDGKRGFSREENVSGSKERKKDT